MSRKNSTKIISTIGPASNHKKILFSMVQNGVNAFRLNFSHGDFSQHLKSIKIIRDIEENLQLSLPIIGDLQGPKFRIGNLKNDFNLKKGDKVNFYLDQDYLENKKQKSNIYNVPISNKLIFSNLIPGKKFLIDDGKLVFNILKIFDKYFETEIMNSGILKSKKGINFPNLDFNISPLTDKDKKDLDFIIKQKLDYIALSFVQRTSDVLELRSLIGSNIKIISKIEKPQALKDIDNIIRASDAVMIARGDLGVELSPQEVPTIQKQLIQNCRKVGKPVIVATQMLESMINLPSPTRAEASDVAGAVFDGADAVMLSAETSIGNYPEESVSYMNSIINSSEDHIKKFPNDGPSKLDIEESNYHAVAQATVDLSEKINAKLILGFTKTGNTAIRIARERPKMTIIAATPDSSVRRRLNLIWGIKALFIDEGEFEECLLKSIKKIKELDLASSGDNIIVVSGMPFGIEGSTNSIRIEKL
jgi:pyruvate kinase|tara:strand:- start:13 stop:1440 length:1428 start_codon:yes stop_codon:yes gene_type:complete